MTADYTEKDIVRVLHEVGITKGNDVFLHSNLGFFGRLEGCQSANELCATFLRAIQDAVGKEGTIITPTYSYSFCHNELYDPYNTRTCCGMLSEYVLRQYPDNRTLDPNFSVCGTGPNMTQYKNCNIHDSFGEKSFWETFKENKGIILCMNYHLGSTMIHYIERKNHVAYRYNKAFNGERIINGNLIRDYAVHFVYDNPADAPCIERITALCKEEGISMQGKLGRGMIVALSANRYYKFFSDLLKERPRALCREESVKNE